MLIHRASYTIQSLNYRKITSLTEITGVVFIEYPLQITALNSRSLIQGIDSLNFKAIMQNARSYLLKINTVVLTFVPLEEKPHL